MSGLNNKGFDRKTRAEIQADMEAKAKNYFGNNVNLGDNSPLGMILKLIAYSLSLLWYVIEAVYNSAFVDTATGQSLDYVGKYIGLSRGNAQKAEGTVIIKGTIGTTVPEGYLFEINIEPVIQFETVNETEINSFGQVEADIRAVEPGSSGNVPSNSITVIVNPISGVDSVYNPDRTENGLDKETDFEFRKRYYNSMSLSGTATIEAIKASLLDITGVIGAEVTHNPTMDTVDSMPPKSIQCFVFGAEDDEVAQTIFESKAAGIETYGTTSVDIIDSMDNTHTINFTRPTEVNIYANATLTTTDNFPEDGYDLVEKEIIKYIGGIGSDEVEHLGLSLGEDVIYTKVISKIHNIDGISDVELYIGTTDNPTGQSNITIGNQEVAVTSTDNVEVM